MADRFSSEGGPRMAETTPDPNSIWIGIDVGKTHHHACAVDMTGQQLWARRIDNDESAIEDLITHARNTSPGPVVWAVDLISPVAALLKRFCC
jgi:predicted NBD/HSP70 family sugar kinase